MRTVRSTSHGGLVIARPRLLFAVKARSCLLTSFRANQAKHTLPVLKYVLPVFVENRYKHITNPLFSPSSFAGDGGRANNLVYFWLPLAGVIGNLLFATQSEIGSGTGPPPQL